MNANKGLLGVEIFAAGHHNGDDYTEQDIDDMITAYNMLDYVPPLKCGHGEDKPGMPALGWVKNLRRVGSKLVADFTDMPDIVHDYVKSKRFNTVSAEVYWNLKRGGNQFRRALKAVALLGAEIPAVAGLKPLHELFSAEAVVKFGEAKTVVSSTDDQTPSNQANKDEQMSKELEEKLAKFEADLTAEKAAREAAETKAKEAADKATEAEARVTQLSTQLQTTGVDTVLHSLGEREREAKFAQERSARESAEKVAKAEKEAREAIERQYATEKAAREALEETQRRDRIDRVASSCRIPALRPFVQQFVDLATKTPDAKVYNEKGESITALKAIEEFVTYANANAGKMLQLVSSQTKDIREDGDGEDAAAEVDKRARKYALDHKATYPDAMKAVLQEDPALGERYMRQFRSA